MIRLSEFKKRKKRLLSLILTVILLSGSIPLDSLLAFADSAGQDFSVTETSFSENVATISWEYTYNEGEERIFELDTDVVPEDGPAEGDMVSQDEN